MKRIRFSHVKEKKRSVVLARPHPQPKIPIIRKSTALQKKANTGTKENIIPKITKRISSKGPGVFNPPPRINIDERRAIVTISVGNELKWMFDLLHPFMKEYADKCNADFIIIDDNWRAYGEHPCYLKQCINALWYRYDRVLYIDSDILIKPDAPNIFEEVSDKLLGVYNELDYCNESLKNKKIEYFKDYVNKYNDIMKKLGHPVINIDQWNNSFYNMGLFLCNKWTNPHVLPVADIMRLDGSPHYDQIYGNLMIYKHRIPVYELSWKWDCYKDVISSPEISLQNRTFENSYFIHYCGNSAGTLKSDLIKYGLIKDENNHLKTNLLTTNQSVELETFKEKNELKKFVCTIIVGDKYRRMAEYSLPTIERLAKNCNADLIIFDESYSEGYEHPILMKTEMNKLWDRYEQGCYIDLDMLVKKDTPNPFKLVPVGTLGVVERGKYWKNKPKLKPTKIMSEYLEIYNKLEDREKLSLDGWDGRYFNAGFFVCDKNTIPYIKEDLVLTGYEHEFYEQTLFNLLIVNKRIKVTELPIDFNRSPSENSALGTRDLLEKCWISHYTVGEEQLVNDAKRLKERENG